MITQEELQSADVIYGLIKNGTSQAVVKEFLKDRGIPHSAANSDDLYERRIKPALQAGDIVLKDLRDLLRRVEECGRQHIFLYWCKPERASELTAERRIRRIAQEKELTNIMTNPLDLELPDRPSLVDIRFEYYPNGKLSALVIKQVETRTVNRLVGVKHEPNGLQMAKIYDVEKKRAVNIARLSVDGELEIRIASQDNSTKYADNIRAFFGAINEFLPRSEFQDVSLTRSKARILKDQDALKTIIRYGNSEAANDFGYRLGVSSSSQEEDIFDDAGLREGLKAFLDEGGEIKSTNLYFLIPDSEPQREVHVLLSGAHNEFAIPVGCTPEDFSYVCGKVREFNN